MTRSAVQVSDLPSGLSVRIDRFRRGDACLRVWTMWLDDADRAAGQDRHDVVMVHGLGASSQYFERLGLRLARMGTVHLMDLPGFAAVPAPSRPFRTEDFAAVLHAWMDQADLVAPVLVGQSMGTQVVTETLAAYPGSAHAGVLVGPIVNAAERSATRQALRLLQSAPFESHRTRSVVVSAYGRCAPWWVRAVLPGMVRYPIEERIGQVDVPLLLLRGEHDHVAPRPWVEHLTGLAKDGRFVEVEGAGHGVIDDHRDEVARLVVEHARR
ncbi:alpha/beta fold hydrolase [Cellulomonas marina]|uniref:Pimeloyl-ACP methyl ester carboxylesterase n=1 Tax=Cellulomonas marina TaxID=988821 RepID=A0A1I0V5B2_9CELL|nr:alpha/beta fold hydrolase [Cellulomonas marina]GIG28333.1 alpha/beta hydrolase [Cellulomonas marina]SFA71263.1 Pimeloyl-ACP methyl ester carboxylesterase [Cellulomonas marina]